VDRIEAARQWFLHTALSYLGQPYIWGGDDPSGFDCSGLVVECLKTIGLMKEHEDATVSQLAERFQSYRVDSPEKGCLLLYKNEQQRFHHVAICLDPFYQISAGGGDSRTTSVETAWRQNAYIRIRPIPPITVNYLMVDPVLSTKGLPASPKT